MKNKINTILNDELEKLLTKFNLIHDFNNGKLQCKFCKSTINKTNLHSIFPESGDVKLVCDSTLCIDSFYRYLEKKKYGDV